jgi:hypothetical protein
MMHSNRKGGLDLDASELPATCTELWDPQPGGRDGGAQQSRALADSGFAGRRVLVRAQRLRRQAGLAVERERQAVVVRRA